MTKEAKPAFLRRCWYVYGLSEELDELGWMSRRVLGEPVLLMRTVAGDLRAIADRCPHRFVPLSLGHIAEGTVQCAYHGLAFDSSGRCTHNPHGVITGALNVRSYPIVQTGPLIWIWMGDPEGAAETPAPQYFYTTDSGYMTRGGYLRGLANYQLMADNILDLSHIEFLHPALGTEAVRRAGVKVEAPGNHVVTTRLMTGELLPEGLARVYQTGTVPVNREMRVEWQAPALMELRITIEPLEGDNRTKRGAFTLHLFTPESETSTHYFYVAAMDRATFTSATIDAFRAALGKAFTSEDKPIIDAQQAMIGYDCDIMDLRPALLGIDKAPMMARRKLQQMIDAETARSTQ
jgi:vanillate O-demethylase monooxygenase subunit